MSGDIGLVCSLNRNYVPPDKEQKLFLKIEITPVMSVTESLPLNVCLLIDRSGSMAGEKLTNAKEGALRLVNQLDSKDYCGVVTFDSRVKVVVEGQHVTDKTLFETKIKKIGVGHTTELYKGLEKAFEELKRPLKTSYEPGREPVKRIILLSDGQPTDKKPESDYRMRARDIREMGISVTALGIGKDYNEDLLSVIAEDSGGAWYHITSPGEIPDLFSRELAEMRTVVSAQPELAITLSEGYELTDIHKSAPEAYRISNVRKLNTEYRIPIRDIRAGEIQTFVARIAVPANPEGQYKIGSVSVLGGDYRKTEDLTVNYTDDALLWSTEIDPHSRMLFAVTETQIKAKDGLSGDETALRQARSQLGTLIRDPGVVQESDLANRTTIIGEVLERSMKGMNEEEKKEAKSDLTRFRR